MCKDRKGTRIPKASGNQRIGDIPPPNRDVTAVMIHPSNQTLEQYVFNVFGIPKELLTTEQAKQIEQQHEAFASMFKLKHPPDIE